MIPLETKLQKIVQKYLENSGIWCWRRMEKINCADHMKNGEALHGVKEERNILKQGKEGRLTGLVTSCVGTVI
jgi:hypothetical protein